MYRRIFGHPAPAMVFAMHASTVFAGDTLEEVVVTAALKRSEAETVHTVNILASDELRRKMAATLGATLKQEVGVSYASFGSGVGQPVIRGQTAPRVMVLENSMPSADATNTSSDHANAVEPVLAERIEVLRGPATLLYGSGAIGGVVNVLDGRIPRSVPERALGALEYRHASNGNSDAAAGRLAIGRGNYAAHLSGFTRRNDQTDIPGFASTLADDRRGVIENTDADAEQYTAGASRALEDGYIGFSASHLRNDYGIPPGAHGHHDADEDPTEEVFTRIRLTQDRFDARAEFATDYAWLQEMRVFVSHTDYEHTEFEGTEAGTVFENQTWQLRTESTHEIDLLSGAIGFQAQQRDFSAMGEEAFVPSSESRSAGLFIIESLDAAGLTWEFGGRLDHEQHDADDQTSRDFMTGALSGSALIPVTASGTLKLAVSLAQRAPSTEELYSNGVHVATNSYELGDLSLDEETSLNIDAGLSGQHEQLTWRIDAFYNRMHDYIYQRSTGLFYQPESEQVLDECLAADADECLPVRQWSAGDATFWGLEANLDVQISDTLTLSLFADSVRGRFDHGQNVPRLPPVRAGLGVDWQSGAWEAGFRWAQASRQDRPGAAEDETRGYRDVSSRVQFSTMHDNRRITLALRAENLLDEEIRNAASLLREIAPEPGRSIELALRVELE